MEYSLDEIDKHILYRLVEDARNTTAREVAEEVDVSPGTIGNRIERLEDHGILKGYHADVDYERADNLLLHLYLCHAPTSESERLAREALQISGVVNVRRAMLGLENLHVLAVGRNTEDIGRISRELTEIGIEVQKEGLLEDESYHPYHPYGSHNGGGHPGKDFMTLAGDAELTELRVTEHAPITGMTISEAAAADILSENTLVVAIERDGVVVTPRGPVEFREGDIVTLLFRDGFSSEVTDEFGGELIHQ